MSSDPATATGAISFLGGTPEQQSFVSAAHGATVTAATTVASAAQSGEGPFVTYFGNAAQPASVALVFSGIATSLGTGYDWTYDLTTMLPAPLFEGIVLAFGEPSGTTVTVSAWDGLWRLDALDAAQANTAFTVSLMHQAILFGAGPSITEYAGTATADGAAYLAAATPAAAPASVRNFVFYAAAVLGSTA